ncbi:hypothetical protein GCM10009674_08090 [Nesterenkonia xinjiangensis]
MLLRVGVPVAILLELGAFLGSLSGSPVALGEGWGATREPDVGVWLLLGAGCLPLLGLSRAPRAAALLCAGSYVAYILSGYEFGLTLPPMLVALVLAAEGRRLSAWSLAGGCLAATLVWVDGRARGILDPDVGLLVWVAFGAVSAIFFLIPPLIGELLMARRRVRFPEAAPAPEAGLSPSGGRPPRERG